MSKPEKGNEFKPVPLSQRFTPLRVALRLDMALRTGGSSEVTATRIAWMTPGNGPRWVRGLEILLLPN